MDKRLTILQGNSLDVLKGLPDASVQCCVTSPAYWGLRSYLPAGHPLKQFEHGTEKTPEEFVAKLVAVFAEVRRVLKDDGTLWVNIGDSYSNVGKWGGASGGKHVKALHGDSGIGREKRDYGDRKNKDLVGIPWMLAFALRADGWYLRSDIIWSKPNPMPESVSDRPTRAHEYIFLLSKKKDYFYDADAIKNPPSPALLKQVQEGYSGTSTKDFFAGGAQDASSTKSRIIAGARKKLAAGKAIGSNKRDVWTVATKAFKGAHFATFPPELILPCVLAGSRSGDTVLDVFGGSGTTGKVALEQGRSAIIIELNPEYQALISKRCIISPK